MGWEAWESKAISVCMYSGPRNNKNLKCEGLLICTFFFNKYVQYYIICGWLNMGI